MRVWRDSGATCTGESLGRACEHPRCNVPGSLHGCNRVKRPIEPFHVRVRLASLRCGKSEAIDQFDELRVAYTVALVSSPLLQLPLALLTLPNLYSQSVLKHLSVPDIHGSL